MIIVEIYYWKIVFNDICPSFFFTINTMYTYSKKKIDIVLNYYWRIHNACSIGKHKPYNYVLIMFNTFTTRCAVYIIYIIQINSGVREKK